MADQFDIAADFAEAHTDRHVAAARRASAAIPRGQPGECEGCVEDSPRLVEVAGLLLCARCRDKRERRR
ncbi:hypothetical protein GGQ80_002058 [Sphingomonas jinjuensis]|uniref:Conjugal transfer protein TraR n=1 Tax=Sphingomonas jinjuensis TaxID=535907 RepID=A0A840FJL3_9SPHN|nr:conjugal transfer protein TraR [Sphingomonas jinjuensis]MBB4154148.1 hypothetical protein [Sphingomonas jinjuensis]